MMRRDKNYYIERKGIYFPLKFIFNGQIYTCFFEK